MLFKGEAVKISLVFCLLISFEVGCTDDNKYTQGAFICRLLGAKFIDSQPWAQYPIIYEPIMKGRLTIWSGVSTLPGGDFDCSPINGTSSAILRFATIAEKFDWTFFDMTTGVNHYGVTINTRENVRYMIKVRPEQSDSFLDCNRIESLEMLNETSSENRLRTMCRDCSRQTINLMNNQINEMIRLRFDNEIEENLSSHLMQLISTQYLSGPIQL